MAIPGYKEIRGKIKKKKHLFGRYAFIITDGKKTAKVYVGKCIYEDLRFYDVGSELTVGYIGHMVMNIRPGIVYDEE